jgi:nucleoid-associated protein EbfC
MGMGNLAKMAQQMQAEMARVQAELDALTLEASAGGGAVRAVVNGRDVIDPEDAEMLQDLVTAAVNDGLRQVKERAEQMMSRVTGGMRLPGLG